jgi:acyl-[acyl carrier protein]--UDP-N-acetylglucosamine O-acyltransferase
MYLLFLAVHHFVRPDVHAAVTMKSAVSKDVTPYSQVEFSRLSIYMPEM